MPRHARCPPLSRRSLWEVKWASGLSWGHIILSHPCDKFQLTIVVLEVVNYGEPSQSTKPAITCLQFQPINMGHKACKSYSVTLYEGRNLPPSYFANIFIAHFFSHQQWAFGPERLVFIPCCHLSSKPTTSLPLVSPTILIFCTTFSHLFHLSFVTNPLGKILWHVVLFLWQVSWTCVHLS